MSRRARLINKVLVRLKAKDWVADWVAAGDDQARLLELAAERRKDDMIAPPGLFSRKWQINKIDLSTGFVHHLRSKAQKNKNVMLYFHAGYFAVGPAPAEWFVLSRFCQRNSLDLIVLDYPRIPEATAVQTIASADASWELAVNEYGAANTVIFGASAGGGLAILHSQKLVDAGADLPAAVALSSPFVDLTASHAQAPALEKTDVLISIEGWQNNAAMWAGDFALTDPAVAPQFGTVAGLPPMHLQAGSDEVLFAELRDWAPRVKAAGGTIEFFEDPAGQHCGVFMPTPEGKAIRDSMSAFFNRHL